MTATVSTLREDALQIWHAGVRAVRAERLVRAQLRVEGPRLWIGQTVVDLERVRRIAVVGGGKAGGGMAAAVEQVLGRERLVEKQVTGWVNVPAGCDRPLQRIHLHPARPMGVNEPTEEAARGTEEILRIVRSLTENDLCLCLISGGGSALLPAPVPGISLADKVAVTRHLSAAGASIYELNAVRKRLSRIKGGGLARECRAGQLHTLIISDVLGDPLDVVASGPTVADNTTAAAALAVLDRFAGRDAAVSPAVLEVLRRPPAAAVSSRACRVTNLIIGNNAMAVEAAGLEAERRGHEHAMISATRGEPTAEEVGEQLAAMAGRMRSRPGPNCLVSGGEPVVKLVEPSRRGLGGRNQQLALAAIGRLGNAAGIVLLAGGTDGEDGPTDAAGAVVDAQVVAEAGRRGLDPADYLARNDAYHFFEPLDALIKTGPTHTNVCDLRVVLVDRAG